MFFEGQARKVTQSRSIEDLNKDLLVKILSFLPTNVAVSTSVLSKEWKMLWRWLPRLDFNDTNFSQSQCQSLHKFINNSLPHHQAPVLESFSLKISKQQFFLYEDIIRWVELVISRSIRELTISCASDCPEKEHTILESSLYTCKTLVSLKLQGLLFVEVPSNVRLPLLKTLMLRDLGIHSVEDLQLFLSNCPILEDLTVVEYVFEVNKNETAEDFSIKIPTLQRLSIDLVNIRAYYRVVISTPSLKYFKVTDFVDRSCVIENMPKIEEAYIWVVSHGHEVYLRAITSVKRLWLCVKATRAEEVIVFNQLEHLMICTCEQYWGYVVAWLLKGLPKLQVLKVEPFELETQEHVLDSGGSAGWEEPDNVPLCFFTSLDTFKWRKHECEWRGYQDEFDLGRYVLENACCLKTASIVANSEEQLDMITNELSLFPLASTTCELKLSVDEIIEFEDSDDDDDDDDNDDSDDYEYEDDEF